MSLLLEIHSSSIPSSYMALFPHLLQPALWERTGNIPPLVRLLQAFLEKGGATIASAAADKIVSDDCSALEGFRSPSTESSGSIFVTFTQLLLR